MDDAPTEVAYQVGTNEIGYVLVKAPSRHEARTRFPEASAEEFASWSHLRAIWRPEYDHLPEGEAERQWSRDMCEQQGGDWCP